MRPLDDEDFFDEPYGSGDGTRRERLGSLHALERVGQDNPSQRQTIVDVVCAYLRMPYSPGRNQEPDEPPVEYLIEQRSASEEQHVRLTAQKLLFRDLWWEAGEARWRNMHIDLSGTTVDCVTLLEVERDGGGTRLVPVTVELLADGDDLVLDPAGVRWGLLRGRRERGTSPGSPSAR